MKNLALSSSLMLAMILSTACNQATAMSRPAPIVRDVPAAPAAGASLPAPVLAAPTEQVGTFEQGVEIGLRNGGLTVLRLKQRTVGTVGCEGLDDLQTALLAVTRVVRPPAQSGDQLVAGFFTGYLRALREGIREARAGCDQLSFDSGAYAGTLYGTLFCQASSVSHDVLGSIETEALYEGWTGGNAERIAECEEALAAAASACELQTTERLAEVSCTDRLPIVTDGE
jgi:hypothetical protein